MAVRLTAGLLPYSNPRYGFFFLLCACNSPQHSQGEAGEERPSLLLGDCLQAPQAVVRRHLHLEDLGEGVSRLYQVLRLLDKDRGKCHQRVFVCVK